MDSASSGERTPINANQLAIEPFLETRNVQSFDCGNKALNDFLCTKEVGEYEAEGLGKTYLVYFRGDLVAYFTVSFDGLRVQYLQRVKSFTKFAKMRIETIPALKIGRLAVDRRFQRRKIGEKLLKYIAGMALDMGKRTGVRLLILQAKPDSIEFYEECGFQLAFETHSEKKRTNKTMFLDLLAVPD